ncbi:hypothetical protein [Helicobacter felis]|nr:hypothetical protein [Helicobacter felis]
MTERTLASQSQKTPQTSSALQNNPPSQYGPLLRYCRRKMEEYQQK